MPGFRITGIDVIGGSEAITKAVEEAMKESEKFDLYDVVVTSDHAIYVEYGTNGADPTVPGVHNFLDSAKERIYRWVSLKPSFASMTPKQRKEIAYPIYKKIMEQGITAAPYARPAIRDLLMNEDLTRRFEEGATMEDVAESLANRMKNNLLDNDSYYTGDLMDSIQVVKADSYEVNAEEPIKDEQQKEQWDQESNETKHGKRKGKK